jgi:hypothetical protein
MPAGVSLASFARLLGACRTFVSYLINKTRTVGLLASRRAGMQRLDFSLSKDELLTALDLIIEPTRRHLHDVLPQHG